MSTLQIFLFGVASMAFGSSGLFFLRFWTKTRDRLFLCFAAAFAILAIERGVLAALGTTNEFQAFIYLPRLAAFVIILYAVFDKNRKDMSRT